MEEEAPEIPHNAFLSDDRTRFGETGQPEPPNKRSKVKREKEQKKKKKKASS